MFSPLSGAAGTAGATPVTTAYASTPVTGLATASMQARESPHGVARRTPASPTTDEQRAASPMARRALELSVALVNLTSQPSAHPPQHAAPVAHTTAARDGSFSRDAGLTSAARGFAGSDEPVLLPRRAPPQPPVGSFAPFLDSGNTGRPLLGSPAFSSPIASNPASSSVGTTSSAPAHSAVGGFSADTGDALTLQLLAQSPVAQNALQQLSHERDRVASLCATELASVQLAWTKLTEERQRFESERAAFADFHAHATQSQHAITSQLASLKEELVEQQARLRMQSVQVAAERDILKEAKADLEADRQALNGAKRTADAEAAALQARAASENARLAQETARLRNLKESLQVQCESARRDRDAVRAQVEALRQELRGLATQRDASVAQAQEAARQAQEAVKAAAAATSAAQAAASAVAPPPPPASDRHPKVDTSRHDRSASSASAISPAHRLPGRLRVPSPLIPASPVATASPSGSTGAGIAMNRLRRGSGDSPMSRAQSFDEAALTALEVQALEQELEAAKADLLPEDAAVMANELAKAKAELQRFQQRAGARIFPNGSDLGDRASAPSDRATNGGGDVGSDSDAGSLDGSRIAPSVGSPRSGAGVQGRDSPAQASIGSATVVKHSPGTASGQGGSQDSVLSPEAALAAAFSKPGHHRARRASMPAMLMRRASLASAGSGVSAMSALSTHSSPADGRRVKRRSRPRRMSQHG